MPEFNMYATPGSAVADTLREILRQRREEARQGFLDKLAEEEQRSVIETRKSQADLASRAESRALEAEKRAMAVEKAQIEEAIARREAALLTTLPHAPVDVADISNPDLVNVLRGRGYIQDLPTVTPGPFPGMSPEDMPTIPGKEVTLGSQQFQEREVAREQLRNILQSPEMSAMHPVAAKIIEAGGSPPVGLMIKPKGQVVLASGQPGPVIEGDFGTQFIERPYPPVGPAGLLTPRAVRITNPETREVVSQYLTPDQIASLQLQGMQVEPAFAATSPLLPGDKKLTSQDVSNLAKSYGDMTENQLAAAGVGRFDWRGLKEKAEVSTGVYRKMLGGLAAKLDADPDILDVVMIITSDPELSSLPTIQALGHPNFKRYFEKDFLQEAKENEFRELSRLLLLFRGLPVAAP